MSITIRHNIPNKKDIKRGKQFQPPAKHPIMKKYKFIKLNKFDKSHDITWESLNNFSVLPSGRAGVLMTNGEREEFVGLLKELENKPTFLRVSGGTEANIFIVERAD